MTFSEAENIIDIVGTALQSSAQHGYHPKSSLKGYNLSEIDTALKIIIANIFLCLSQKPDHEQKFSEAIKVYEDIPLLIEILFVSDDELEKLNKLTPDSLEYRRQKINIWPSPLDESMKFKNAYLASLETPSSFADYCKYVGPEDKLYWQKIYTRINLESTETSPRANFPVVNSG